MAALRRSPAAEAAAGVEQRLAANVRRLRRERGMTLDALAAKCGVSRAMISKVERGEVVPTATVLGKLALGLEVGLSQLLGERQPLAPTLLPPAEQAIFRDPLSGLERRSLSPSFPDRSVDLVLNTLPAGGHVSFPAHHHGVEEYLHVSRGTLVVTTAGDRHTVGPGSTLFYPAHVPHEFINETDEAVEFYIVVEDTKRQ